jgi:hypothetical protein
MLAAGLTRLHHIWRTTTSLASPTTKQCVHIVCAWRCCRSKRNTDRERISSSEQERGERDAACDSHSSTISLL